MEGKGRMEGSMAKDDRSRKEGMTANLNWKINDQRKLNGGSLVGKLVIENNMNRNTVVRTIRKGWNLLKKEDLEIVDTDHNAFIFNFWRKEDYVRILKARPWSIQGTLLNIQVRQDFTLFREVDFNSCPVWIQFHDLPPEAMYVENAKALREMIGEVVMVEDLRCDDLSIRSFLRARAVIDLWKPLVTGMWSPRPEKEPIWIKVKYERIQNFCLKCERLGHDQRVCNNTEEVDEESNGKFGSWLSTFAARNVESVLVCCKDGWEEYGLEEGRREREKVLNILEGRRSFLSPSVELKKQEEEVNLMVRIEITRDEKENSNVTLIQKRPDVPSDSSLPKVAKKEISEAEVKVNLQSRRRVNVRRSPKAKMDLSKAIVVYGNSSPLSEVTASMRNVRLKRGLEGGEGGSSRKKRMLCFEEVSEAVNISTRGIQKRGAEEM